MAKRRRARYSRRRRRGGRVAEGARLESVYAGNRIEGSNPSPSAIPAGAVSATLRNPRGSRKGDGNMNAHPADLDSVALGEAIRSRRPRGGGGSGRGARRPRAPETGSRGRSGRRPQSGFSLQWGDLCIRPECSGIGRGSAAACSAGLPTAIRSVDGMNGRFDSIRVVVVPAYSFRERVCEEIGRFRS